MSARSRLAVGALPRGGAALAVLLAAVAAGCDGREPPAPPASATVGTSDAAAPAVVATAREAPVEKASSSEIGGPAARYLAEPRFAAADLARGELLSLACAACHTFGAGQNALIGPNLHGVFGRPSASVPGFDYSPALQAANIVWTPDTLESWLADPASFVVGTKMAFTGYRSADDRRDLIAYLLHATEE